MRKLSDLLKEKKKRRLLTLALIAPFLIIIAICGFLIFKEAKSMLSLASESINDTSASHMINDGTNSSSYILRDKATDIQEEYFKELKDYYENQGVEGHKEEVAASIVKNYVADFYTWSNKAGQYDVGGMYYVYSEQRYEIYIQARDQFYKYINNYINEYGNKNLIEVENVEATAVKRAEAYKIDETDEEGNPVTKEYESFDVVANWTYVTKEDSTFKTSSYDTKGYFVVIDRGGRYEIVYAGKEKLGA